MDFPLIDYLDEDACYRKLVELLHPDGLACPSCGQRRRLGVHHRHREPVLDYQCGDCGRVFNAWTGALLQAAEQETTRMRSAAAFACGNAWKGRMNCQQPTAWPKGGRHERSASHHLSGPAR